MTTRFKDSIFFAPVLVLASMTSLTMGASIAKSLFPLFGASGTTFLRLGLAAIMMLLVWKPWRAEFSRSQWKLLLAYGVGLGVMNLLFYEAIARLPIGIAIAIEFMGPLSIAFFYSRSKIDVLWATLALVGIVLLLPKSDGVAGGFSKGVDWVGVAFALGAAAAWAFYIVIGQRAGAGAHAGYVSAFGILFGWMTVVPFGFTAMPRLFENPAFLPSALAVGLLSSAIPYSLEMVALKKMDSKTFGIFLSLEPAIGALSAYLFLSEKLLLAQLAAIGCVIIASIGSTLSASRKRLRDQAASEVAAP